MGKIFKIPVQRRTIFKLPRYGPEAQINTMQIMRIARDYYELPTVTSHPKRAWLSILSWNEYSIN